MVRLRAALGIAAFFMFSTFFAPEAFGVIRRGWYLEDISKSPAPTAFETSRNQVGVSALNQSDSVNARASGLFALPAFEVQVEAGQIYGGITGSTGGLQLKDLIARDMTYFALEFGRYFVDSKNRFGRVAIKFVDFVPAQQWAWRGALQTGVRATASSPWDVDFNLSGFFYFNHQWDFMFAGLGTGRTHYFGKGESQSFRLGGEVGFGQKIRLALGESLLFSLVPNITYRHPRAGDFTLKVPIRIWIDRDDAGAGGMPYISQFDPPAAELRWSMYF